jgi:poly-gamma-glutamate synthesis protein (capsule biosynthesis protein)
LFRPEPGFVAGNSVTIAAGGDLSTSEVLTPESTEHLWDEVGGFYFSADIVSANLETPVFVSAKPGNVPAVCLTAPDLNTTSEMFSRFTDNGRGINFFSTANNHSLDQGEEGLVATLDFLDTLGYGHVGTSRTPREQDDIPVIEKNGARIAFISYTYSLNARDPVPGKEYMTNHIRLNKPDADIGLIKKHVDIARQKKADVIIAMLHWSIEFETYPIRNVIEIGHRIAKAGVDVIFGGHAHVAQPMERYSFVDPETGGHKSAFIIYSLGELLSYNAFSRNSRLTWLLKLVVTKGKLGGEDKTVITELKVFPVYTLIVKSGNKKYDYRLLDFRKMLSDIKAGNNVYGFSSKGIEELKRLERLLYKRLLPSKHDHLLTDQGKQNE